LEDGIFGVGLAVSDVLLRDDGIALGFCIPAGRLSPFLEFLQELPFPLLLQSEFDGLLLDILQDVVLTDYCCDLAGLEGRHAFLLLSMQLDDFLVGEALVLSGVEFHDPLGQDLLVFLQSADRGFELRGLVFFLVLEERDFVLEDSAGLAVPILAIGLDLVPEAEDGAVEVGILDLELGYLVACKISQEITGSMVGVLDAFQIFDSLSCHAVIINLTKY
jgi:hypothetical protein